MNNKMVRIQFEVSASLAKEIEAFEAEAEITSHREFYGNLIALWRWSAQRVREGKTITAMDIKTLKYNELTMPSLENIKFKAMAEKELSLAGMIPHPSMSVLQQNEDLTTQEA